MASLEESTDSDVVNISMPNENSDFCTASMAHNAQSEEHNNPEVQIVQEANVNLDASCRSTEEVNGTNINFEQFDSLSPEMQEKMEALRQRGQPVNILVIGPTGSGKSTLINALMGKTVAKAGHGAKGVTREVGEYEGEFMNVKMKIYDTIGFRDSEGKTDSSILKEIAASKEFDLVLVCIKLEDRISRDIQKIFVELALSLREEVWKNAIVVATFANLFIKLDSVPETKSGREQAIKDKISEFQESVFECLKGHVGENIIRDIPYRIAGKAKKRKLPTTDDWLQVLWDTCIDRCSDEAQPFLTMLAKHRLAVEAGAFSASVGVGIVLGIGIGAAGGSVVPGLGTAIGAGVGGAVGGGAGAIVGSSVSGTGIFVGRFMERMRKIRKH